MANAIDVCGDKKCIWVSEEKCVDCLQDGCADLYGKYDLVGVGISDGGRSGLCTKMCILIWEMY